MNSSAFLVLVAVVFAVVFVTVFAALVIKGVRRGRPTS